MNKITRDKVKVDSYPYGSMRTEAFFSVEFRKGKGFRSVFQTVNPKTGRLNAEKKGTYSPVMWLEVDEKGFVSFRSMNFYGNEGLNRDCARMAEMFWMFTSEERNDIYAFVLMQLKVTARALVAYCGADFEAVKPLLNDAVEACVEGIKTGDNTFGRIKLDEEALEATKKKGFNPFKTTTYEMA